MNMHAMSLLKFNILTMYPFFTENLGHQLANDPNRYQCKNFGALP